MISIGTDIVEVSRLRELISKYNDRFLKRTFSDNEIRYCSIHSDSAIHFAGRFSAKEAVKKAISSVPGMNSIPYNLISIKNDKTGRPYLENTFPLAKKIDVSISHTREHAIAFAILSNDKSA
tara:strand:- start:172 stop:537 length:366 start_codon:yes stop_codon:yes gene_type:complete